MSPPDCGPVAYQPKEAELSSLRRQAETVLQAIPGVQGVGEGRNAVGDPAWIAYVRDAHTAGRLPAFVAERPVVAETSGEIGILPVGGSGP